MGGGSRCFVVPCLALLLGAALLRAQDGASMEQIPSESLPAEAAFAPFRCPPNAFFRADWLWTSHAGMWSDTRSFIDGPDATGFNNLPNPTGDNGYRLQGGVRLGNWYVEGVYSHFGDWTSSLNENVNGVAFNPGALAGNWAGENSINASTYFAPIATAANLTAPANTASDQSGLGPSAAFLTDAKPALMAYSHTEFFMTEANVRADECIFPLLGHRFQLGGGYVNANLNNDSWAGLTGTFRATNVSGTTVGLPNSVLTAPTGGNLTLYSGGGAGFSDPTGSLTPSQLFFTHAAKTRNELNGAQVILDGDLLEWGRLDFNATLKGGIFDNFAQGAITETYSTTNNDLSAYARTFSASCHHLSFMGGVGIDAGFHLTDEVSLFLGYDVVFLTNLALGPEQINGLNNNWYHVQTDGTAVLQAVHTGLEISF